MFFCIFFCVTILWCFDGKFITAKGAGVATEFGLTIVSALKDKDTAEKIGKAIQMK